MDKIYRLDKGYYVEVVNTFPNEDGDSLQGVLRNIDKKIVGVKHDKCYSTVDQVIFDFNLRVLPKYLRENKLEAILGLGKKNALKHFISDYLAGGHVRYVQTLDILDILEAEGYAVPEIDDESVSVPEYQTFMKVATKLGKELKTQLQYLGFKADQNTNNVIDHDPKKLINKQCKHLVFTRTPDIVGYHAIKSLKDIKRNAVMSHLTNLSIDVLKNQNPKVGSKMFDLCELKKELCGSKVLDVVDKVMKVADQFDNLVKRTRSEDLEVYRVSAPKEYHEWCAVYNEKISGIRELSEYISEKNIKNISPLTEKGFRAFKRKFEYVPVKRGVSNYYTLADSRSMVKDMDNYVKKSAPRSHIK